MWGGGRVGRELRLGIKKIIQISKLTPGSVGRNQVPSFQGFIFSWLEEHKLDLKKKKKKMISRFSFYSRKEQLISLFRIPVSSSLG